MNSIRCANNLLLEIGYPKIITSLSDIRCAAEKLGYFVFSYLEGQKLIEKYKLRQYTQLEGFAVFTGSDYIIFFQDDLSYSEKMFVIAHELGHIRLEHTYSGILGKADSDAIENEQEHEADVFAYQVLAPICVLRRYGIRQVEDIEFLTALKGTRAEAVFISYSKITKQPREKEVLNLFFPHSKFKFISIIFIPFCLLALLLSNSVFNALYYDNVFIESKNILEKFIEKEVVATQTIYYWTPSGEAYHLAPDCYHIQHSTVLSGTLEEAKKSGKNRVCQTCLENFVE